MTQAEMDDLCVMAQHALTVLIDEYIPMYRNKDIFLEGRSAQLLGLNSLMLATQDYYLTVPTVGTAGTNPVAWDYFTTDELETIQEKIIFLSEWRY